jgi:hypothetical protein
MVLAWILLPGVVGMWGWIPRNETKKNAAPLVLLINLHHKTRMIKFPSWTKLWSPTTISAHTSKSPQVEKRHLNFLIKFKRSRTQGTLVWDKRKRNQERQVMDIKPTWLAGARTRIPCGRERHKVRKHVGIKGKYLTRSRADRRAQRMDTERRSGAAELVAGTNQRRAPVETMRARAPEPWSSRIRSSQICESRGGIQIRAWR